MPSSRGSRQPRDSTTSSCFPLHWLWFHVWWSHLSSENERTNSNINSLSQEWACVDIGPQMQSVICYQHTCPSSWSSYWTLASSWTISMRGYSWCSSLLPSFLSHMWHLSCSRMTQLPRSVLSSCISWQEESSCQSSTCFSLYLPLQEWVMLYAMWVSYSHHTVSLMLSFWLRNCRIWCNQERMQ